MCGQAEPQSLEVEQSQQPTQQPDSKGPQAAAEAPLNREAPSSCARILENQEASCSAPISSVAIEAAGSSHGEGLGPATRPDTEMRLPNAHSEPASEAAPPANGTAAEAAAPARKPLNLDTATQSENSAWFCVVPLVQPSASAEPVSRGWSECVLHGICVCFPWVMPLPALGKSIRSTWRAGLTIF